MKTIHEINEAISKMQNTIALLEELKISIQAEQCRYVVKLETEIGNVPLYSLYDNQTKSLLNLDRAETLKSFLNKINATETDVYIHPNTNNKFIL